MNGWLVAIVLLALHVLLVYFLVKSGKMEQWNLGLMLGIVLMIRTQRGRGLIDLIAKPRRLWAVAGDLGTVVSITGMAGLTWLFFYSVYESLRSDSTVPAFSAAEVFVIPGVNPFVPLWYGIAGLIVTLVVHEGGHGILARANAMRVKSLGILYAVIPIGAFVEPDELDLKVAPRRHRLRVFAAGPAVNMAFAVLFLVAFAGLMGNLTPKDGVYIISVSDDFEAEKAGIQPRDRILTLNGEAIHGYAGFEAWIDQHAPGESITYGLADGRTVTGSIGARWDAFTPQEQDAISSGNGGYELAPGYNVTRYCHDRTATAAGPDCANALVALPMLGVGLFDAERVDYLLHPFDNGVVGFAGLAAQPVGEIRAEPTLSIVLPDAMQTPFHAGTFWVLANLAFWCFWLNLMVGVTNMLPMLPLDGGHVFRDAAGGVVAGLRPGLTVEAREKVVGRIAAGVSILVFAGFLAMLIGPHVLR